MTEEQALDREKRRDYRNAVITQVILLVSMLLMQDTFELLGMAHGGNATWNFYLVLLALYFYLLWDMLRNFTRNRILIYAVLALVCLVYLVNFLANSLFFSLAGPWLRPLNFCLFGSGLGVQLLVSGYALRDLLQNSRQAQDKLWGSACVYFMAGFSFATAYHMLHMFDPLAFGMALPADHLGLTEALFISFNCLVGGDNAYPNSIHLVRNLQVLEGCWGQLYLVLLISRMLLPDQVNENQERP